MVDFTACEVNKFRAYGGANGNKIRRNRHSGTRQQCSFKQ
jgi:hypothetical protein